MVGRELKEAYQYSFREYLDRWTPLDPDNQPHPINEDPDLDDYYMERLNDLRFGIKMDRDKHFVDTKYDVVKPETVPKSFWLNDYELEIDRETDDGFSQSALDEF